MCKINIRERFLYDEYVVANNYYCDTSIISVEMVDTNKSENVFTNNEGFNMLPGKYNGISFPLISKPTEENAHITHMSLHVATDHDDCNNIYSSVKKYIEDADKNIDNPILILVYNDVVDMKSVYFLYEIEIEK